MMWGVGPKTGARLDEFGIKTIGGIASHSEQELVRWFGKYGSDMWRHAHGIDDRPFTMESEAKSISQETTFAKDVGDDLELQRTIRRLAATVGRRLRKSGVSGTTVKLKLRWPDFTTLTRQTSLPQPTDQDEEIYKTALDLLKKVRRHGQEVRLIGVGVSGFKPPLRQMALWDGGTEKMRKLQEAMDDLQEKYGRKIIQRGKG